jgi:hypothetical protein
MEITCTRCHQAIHADNCYCPTCGLPQLQYSAENVPGQAPAERWLEPVRDASVVDWKRAMRPALMLAIPAGVLCSLFSPVNILCLIWMSAASAWVVALYLRNQQPAWITIGAGARIGLVTGLLGAWTAAAVSGISLFVMRFFLHQGKTLDDTWTNVISDQVARQWASAGVDAQTINIYKAWLLSPEGRAGSMLSAILLLVAVLVFFAVGGGALGARLQARARRPQV